MCKCHRALGPFGSPGDHSDRRLDFLFPPLRTPETESASRQSLAAGGRGGGPEEQPSHEEGVKVVQRFLDFASHHGVEEVQAFTAITVATPHWGRKEVVRIPQNTIERAEVILSQYLATFGPDGAKGGGLSLVGDERWIIRGRDLEGEWIEVN